MRYFKPLLFLCFAAAVPASARESRPVAAEGLTPQNKIFEEQYESDLRFFPERATSFGDYRYNDKLDDYSLEGTMQRHKADESFLGRLQAIPTTGFSDQEELSHD